MILVLGILFLTVDSAYAGNSLRIPDEFLIKIRPESLNVQNESTPLQTVEDLDNSCLATTPNGVRFEIRTCDPADITQHFRHENGSLKNFQDQCLTQETRRSFTRYERPGTEVCDEATQRINTFDRTLGTNVFFRSCNNGENQNFDFEVNNDSVSFTQNGLCFGAQGSRGGIGGVCFSSGLICPEPDNPASCFRVDGSDFDFDFDNLSISVNSSFCAQKNNVGRFDLNNPDGGSLFIERLIPIVVPL